ncbi:alcohol dehydrogenase catalytic domain-containing protein [Microbacterium lacticum]|uniref:alcohol dehydrogenase catalytic domain-containing protein n=1 Tax=Microbacterium lacticum TaxID=33885 RepID=UPI003A8C7728
MRDDKYKAIVRHAGASAVVERQSPKLAPGDLLLAPEAVSLCGTDHQMLRGLRDDPSSVLGHEGACRVVAGSDRSGQHRIGQRVTVNPTNPNDASFLLGHNIDGLFQQRVLIPRRAVEAGMIVPIPDDVPSSTATLIEPVAIVDYALACLELVHAETLIIIGDGLIGNLAARRAIDSGRWNRIVVAHAGEPGLRWTSETWNDDRLHNCMQTDIDKHLDTGTVAALIATHRDRTPASVDLAHEAAGARLQAIHVTGGVAPGSQARTFPGVDLSGIRTANTGGAWPPRRTLAAFDDRKVVFTGNRGVTSQRLAAAAADLSVNETLVAPLISHVLDMHEAAQLMNQMVATRSRHIDDRLVMRLVAVINPELVTI